MAVDVAPQSGVSRGGNPGTLLGNPGAQDLQGIGGIDSAGNTLVSLDSRKPAYFYGVSAFSMVATPTAVVVIQGSATKTVRIRGIYLSGAATAAGTMPVVVTRRSTAGTVGSAVLTAVTGSKADINDAAPTAVVSTVGTANYTTLGTTAGVVAAGRLCMTALGSGVGVSPTVFEFGHSGKALVLRGTSDYVTIEFSGAAIPSGGVLDFYIKMDEDNS